MKLLRVNVLKADTCGGLLDGLDVGLRSPFDEKNSQFSPICLVGPNGSGKSQFLQVVAEIFQAILHAAVPREERRDGNERLQFEVEYIANSPSGEVHIRASRTGAGKRPKVRIERLVAGEWEDCTFEVAVSEGLLPTKVVGYTSGGNETLSLPFLLSRSGYADEVATSALTDPDALIPDTRLMLIDYSTHLEVLIANLLLGTASEKAAILDGARLGELHSLRCVVQLDHSAAPTGGVQLTDELKRQIDALGRCSTCYRFEAKARTYTFDFLVTEETRRAVQWFWSSALELYSSLHKLSMLNDLAISRSARQRLRKETMSRRFVSKLPEPQDEEKVFRFERVSFLNADSTKVVDYVSLSDGEHQRAQLLGMFCMVSYGGAIFLLDEPESHFNPQWRVQFISNLMSLPTSNGSRGEVSVTAKQDCLITTHAPFVPSDMSRERVVIFGKNEGGLGWRNPEIETYGSTFDAILGECFGVRPPISDVPKNEIDDLMKNGDVVAIREAMGRLGMSVDKLLLADRLRQLTKGG